MEIEHMLCTPKKTITFNKSDWYPGHTYTKGVKYRYYYQEGGNVEVHIGRYGFIVMTQEEFEEKFNRIDA